MGHSFLPRVCPGRGTGKTTCLCRPLDPGARGVMVLLIIASLFMPSCSRQKEPPPQATIPVEDKLSQDIRDVAARYFALIPQDELKDQIALAKRINCFVVNYCTCTEPLEPSMEKLLKNCRTQCSGYVYVFVKIAEHFGLRTRVVNLFNIPVQGNHTMVEVAAAEGRWALFDPSFGAFFTPEGDVHGEPCSLDELYFNYNPETLQEHVVQARTIDPMEIHFPLENLYADRSFSSKKMNLHSYLRAETNSSGDPLLYSLLWMDIDMSRDAFSFGRKVESVADGESMFLEQTNKLLGDRNPANDISYNMSYLGLVGSSRFKNGYRLTHLKNGKVYRLRLSGVNPSGAALYPHFTDNRAVLQSSGKHEIQRDIFSYTMLFKAKAASAELILEVYPRPDAHMRIFEISIEAESLSG